MELNKASLDRYITGNYGEDQFKGALYDEDEGVKPCMFCDRVVNRVDLLPCTYCGRVACDECAVNIGKYDYCPLCAKCSVCKNEAIVFCESCSALLCPDHYTENTEYDADTGYRETSKTCKGECKSV